MDPKKIEEIPFFVYESDQIRNDRRIRLMKYLVFVMAAAIVITNSVWMAYFYLQYWR